MNTFIYLFVVIVEVAGMALHLGTAVRLSGYVVLGTTLTADHMADAEVQRLLGRARRGIWLHCLIALAASVPAYFLRDTKYLVPYLLAWALLAAVACWGIEVRNTGQLREIKRQRGWDEGAPENLAIDLKSILLKPKMPVGPHWMVPSLLLSVMVVLQSGSPGIGDALPLFIWLVFLILYRIAVRAKTQVYDENSRINMACSLATRRTWSQGLVLASYIMPVLFLIGGLLDNLPLGVVPVLTTGLILLVLILTHGTVRKRREQILAQGRQAIYNEDDENWKYGMYHNPQDNSTFVEKRVGIGWTINLASRKGKLVAGLAILILVGVVVMYIGILGGGYDMKIDGDEIRVTGFPFGTTFSAREIEDITIIDTLPKSVRTWGYGGGRVYMGEFELEGYGKVRLYAHYQTGPFVVITLTEGTVVIHGESGEETGAYYDALIAAAG